MKSVAFFRNSWKKRSKDSKATKEKEKSPMEETMAASAPCTPATATFGPVDHDLPLLLAAHRIRSQSEEVIKAPPIPISGDISSDDRGSVCSLVAEDITMPSAPILDCGCYPRADLAHNPPKNISDCLSNLNLHPPMSGKQPRSTRDSPPVRPPRPPPLNLLPNAKKRPVNTDTSPRLGTNRPVASNPCAIKSVDLIATPYRSPKDSQRRSGDRERLSQSSGTITPKNCAPDGGHSHPQWDALRGMNMAANLPRPQPNSYLPVMTSPRIAQTLIDLSDPPTRRCLYRNGLHTSSTPHLLPRDEELLSVPPLPSSSRSRQAHDDVSAVSLSSFPTPPQTPLFTRRKIAKILALRPASPSLSSPLPISPVLTSDHTPLVTLKTSRPNTSLYQSKSYSSLPRHSSSRGVPPLLFDPPLTPLPTPPTSPGAEAFTPSNSLRSVKSINQLQSKLLPPIPPHTHRATSSAPVSVPEGKPCIKQSGRLTQSRPAKQRTFQPPVSGSMKSVVF